MLDITELLELEEALQNELREHLDEILIDLNRKDKLIDFLQLIGMQQLLGIEEIPDSRRNGIIIVVGQSEVEKDKLSAVARKMGFSKDRFEFYLDYEDAKTFDFRKTQWTDKYSCILVGQMPHSGYAKGDYSSVITALENEDGYPHIVRVGTSGLKITKTSFRQALEYSIAEQMISIN